MFLFVRVMFASFVLACLCLLVLVCFVAVFVHVLPCLILLCFVCCQCAFRKKSYELFVFMVWLAVSFGLFVVCLRVCVLF